MNLRSKLTGLGVFAALAFTMSGQPVSAARYGMAGCGLGSILFESGRDGDKAISDNRIKQVLAATTNGTFGSQTFGITTGTSNCTTGGTALDDKEQQLFVEANQKQLARDMAQGSGEYVTALSALMGCPADAGFGTHAQKNYETFFPASGTNPEQLLMTVKASVASDPVLAQRCTKA